MSETETDEIEAEVEDAPETEPAPKSSKRSTAVAPEALRSQGERYLTLRKASREARDRLDAEILNARKSGVTYAAIAADIGLSVAWVQASLHRSGGVPAP